MPERIAEYLKTTGEQIRWKRARPALTSELRAHLLDERDSCAARGMDEAAAEAEALRQMGDPVAVGQALDRVHRPAPQWGLLLLTGFLAVAGGIIRVLLAVGLSRTYLPLQTALSVLLGFACLLGAYFLDYTALGRHPRVFYWGTVLLGAAGLLLSPNINGRSYYTGYVILFLVPLAYALAVYSLRGRGWGGLLLAAAYGLPLLAAAALTPSALGILLLFFTALVLLLTAIRNRWFNVRRGLAAGLVLGLAAACAALFLLRHWYGFRARMAVAFHPELDPDGGGFQAMAVLDILSGARLWGRETPGNVYAGPTLGRSLPAADTDFLLTSLIHRFGWLPFLLLCGALLTLVLWTAGKCLRQKNDLGRTVAVAIVLALGAQTAAGITMNLGLVLISASCPFISGNLHTILSMALMGLLLSVFRQERIPAGDAAAAPPGERRRLVSWRDGNLIIALDRRNRAH